MGLRHAQRKTRSLHGSADRCASMQHGPADKALGIALAYAEEARRPASISGGCGVGQMVMIDPTDLKMNE